MVSLEALSASDNILLMMLGVTVFIVTVRVVAREHRIKRRASTRPPATVSRSKLHRRWLPSADPTERLLEE
ncbi:hypothetical protein OHA70_23120 [Kribbella sp. NBC_00382]|uniref:hypothetical protein n=1 Tax=Kribbella sp. NBC_00382 TaxID=2975967 RepID=UPI002E1E39B4